MPSTTLNYGFPYPLPTDPVAAGAADIKALADRMEAIRPVICGNVGKLQVAAGSFVGPTNASGGIVIPYGVTFYSVPSVIITNGDEGAGGLWIASVNATANMSQCNVHCVIPWTGTSVASTTVRANWIAIGPYGPVSLDDEAREE